MNRPELLTKDNCQIIFIDHQPQMAFGVQSIDRQVLKNNTVALAKAARTFDVRQLLQRSKLKVSRGIHIPNCLQSFLTPPFLNVVR